MPTLIKMPGVVFTDVASDPRVIPGSLLLVDNTHPSAAKNTLAAGTATYTNLAAIPAKNATTADVPTVATFNTATADTHARMRYTPAGSPMLTSSVTVDVANEQVGLTWPTPILNYFKANKAHAFYIGAQINVVRNVIPSGAAQWVFAGQANVLAWSGVNIGVGRTSAGVAAGYPGSSDSRRLGLSTQSIGSEVAIGVSASDLSTIAESINPQLSVTGPNAVSSWLHATPSFVLRSVWVCDLTVAGLTHAQAWALDEDAHSAAVNSRWSTDTPPAALA